MAINPLAIILYHKQSTSARVRFLLASNQSICFGTELPKLATVIGEGSIVEKEEAVLLHPAMAIRELEQQMGLARDDIEPIKDFRAKVDVPGMIVPVYLAVFKNIDPPFAAAEKIGAKFIAITEARNQPPVELQLLQKAYQYIMG